MIAVLLVVHILIAVTLIVVVLLQRSEGGGLGIGSGGGGVGGFMTARGTADLLTRVTAVLAAIFMMLSLVLSILSARPTAQRSIIDAPPGSPSAPAQPQPPAAPIAR